MENAGKGKVQKMKFTGADRIKIFQRIDPFKMQPIEKNSQDKTEKVFRLQTELSEDSQVLNRQFEIKETDEYLRPYFENRNELKGQKGSEQINV